MCLIFQVLPEDILNTLRVLKAEKSGKQDENGNDITFDQHLTDLAGTHFPAKHFAYLKDTAGNYICYPPDASDPEMAGRPIAFIRDLNAVPGKKPGEDLKPQDRIQSDAGTALHLLRSLHIDKERLKPAPQECVDACNQQDAVIAAARVELANIKRGVLQARRAERKDISPAGALLPRGGQVVG
jgi:hypothetical protein